MSRWGLADGKRIEFPIAPITLLQGDSVRFEESIVLDEFGNIIEATMPAVTFEPAPQPGVTQEIED